MLLQTTNHRHHMGGVTQSREAKHANGRGRRKHGKRLARLPRMIALASAAHGLPEIDAATAWRDRARAEWFDLRPYGANALPIGAGGRGGAWYLDGPFGQAVLRHYRRGGVMARVNREHYLWCGASRTRGARELALLERLVDADLPAPEPIAAAHWREGLLYRAALLMRRIPVRADLMSLVHDDATKAPWDEVGRCIARFHRYGAHHPDLNARNILQDNQGRIVVIDWDRGSDGHRPGRWCEAELQRLERSLRKYRRHVSEAAIADGMQRLRAAWIEAMA